MTENEQERTLDTDVLIGHMLHQTEAVVDVDEQSLARRKTRLVVQMMMSLPKEERRGNRPQSADQPIRHEAARPLNEVVFLTVAEVAAVMRVSKMTVYRLVHSGHLPAIRVGRSFRVPEQAVHEYLRENSMESIESTERP